MADQLLAMHYMIAHTLIPAYFKDPVKTPLVQCIDLTCICCW